MTKRQEEILSVLSGGFRYEESDWITASILMSALLERRALRLPNEGLEEVAHDLELLKRQGLVEFSPTIYHGSIEGFTTRMTARGYNMLHYGRPSLVG